MAHNLAQCKLAISKAAAAGAKALFLPEAADYIASSAAESVSLAQPAETSPFVLGLRAAARDARLHVNVGIHEPADTVQLPSSNDGTVPAKRLKNTLLWIDDSGAITQRYQKLHLFDVNIAGGPVLQESHSVQPGSAIVPPFMTPVGAVGLMICFDLRFPELGVRLAREGAQLLTYPSAFTVPTGAAHWETLLRARAVENQAWVVAAAQVGAHNEKRSSYGHSMIVSPWGEVRAELCGEWDGEARVATAEIDLEQVLRVRREMPLLRRTDVYGQV